MNMKTILLVLIGFAMADGHMHPKVRDIDPSVAPEKVQKCTLEQIQDTILVDKVQLCSTLAACADKDGDDIIYRNVDCTNENESCGKWTS